MLNVGLPFTRKTQSAPSYPGAGATYGVVDSVGNKVVTVDSVIAVLVVSSVDGDSVGVPVYKWKSVGSSIPSSVLTVLIANATSDSVIVMSVIKPVIFDDSVVVVKPLDIVGSVELGLPRSSFITVDIKIVSSITLLAGGGLFVKLMIIACSNDIFIGDDSVVVAKSMDTADSSVFGLAYPSFVTVDIKFILSITLSAAGGIFVELRITA